MSLLFPLFEQLPSSVTTVAVVLGTVAVVLGTVAVVLGTVAVVLGTVAVVLHVGNSKSSRISLISKSGN